MRPVREYDRPQYRKNRRLILAGKPICNLCRLVTATTAHHVIPVSKGGTSELGNLVPACETCNKRLGNKRPARHSVPW